MKLIVEVVRSKWRSWRSYYCISYCILHYYLYSGSNLMLLSSGLIAHSVAFRFSKFMEVVEAMEVVSDYLTTYLLHILISMKAYIPSIGLVAHLQSIDLWSERGGFESRHCRCLFLGSMHRNANSFFINWGLWITLSPEQRLGVNRHKLEIVEDLDNDFPVQYGTELYRKIIIQVPLEV